MIIKSSLIGENPLVSVVVCSYNRVDTIGQTLDSILWQERNFLIEVIVGDDSSKDGTREILQNYQDKYPTIFVLVFQEKNLGIGCNWASIMKLARGKYVAFCDDDDYWHCKDKLQKQAQILDENERYGLVHTNYCILDVNNGKTKEKKANINNTLDLTQALYRGEYLLLTSSVMLRKELIDKYVDLDDYLKYDFPIQDWNTWILISKHTNFYHMDISTVTYRISNNSMSRLNDYDSVISKYDKEKRMYKYLCDKFPLDFPYIESEYDDYVYSVLLNLAFKQKDYRKANQFGKKIGNKSVKVVCSQNRILFWIFLFLKQVRNLKR